MIWKQVDIAIFLDVFQAFDKIWPQGLFHKIKSSSATDLYAIVRFYLFHRTFRIKYGEVVIEVEEINSGLKIVY